MTEIWRPIPDFPGYEVSNYGQVRSFHQRRGGPWIIAEEPQRILKSNKSGQYLFVMLARNGIRYNRRIASLILETFVGPRPKGMDVCHNDCNPVNNRLDNLRYDTRRNNLHDGVGKDTIKRLTNKQAVQIKYLAAKGLLDEELAAEFNVSDSTIKRCRGGQSYGYTKGPLTRRNRKLTDEKVRQMREIAKQNNPPITELAEKYKVTESHVSLLLRGLRRKRAGGPILKPRYASAKSAV